MKTPFLLIILLSVNLVAARDIYIGAIFFEDEEHLSKNFTKYVNDEFYGLQFIFGAQFVPRVRYAISDDSSILEKLVCELLSDGVVAIFGPSSKTSNGEIVSSICNTYGIPHLLYDYNREETLAEKMERSMTLNVYPENLRLAKIFSSIVQSLDWSSYTIIYDSQEGLARLQEVLHLRSVGKTSVKVRSIEADTEFNVMWKEVKETAERRIILDCSPNIILDVLRAAKEFNMTTFENRILITNPDCYCINYTEFLDHNTDITIINLAEDLRDTRDYEDIRTRADRCEKVYETTQMFLLHDAVTLLSEALSALVSKKINPKILRPTLFNCYQRQYWAEGPQILEEMKAVTQPVNGFFRTKQMRYNDFNNREQFELVEEGLNSNTTSVWDSLNMVIKVKKEGSKKQLEYPDLSKETFIIATRIGEPYLRRVVPPNGTILTGNDRYEGYSKDLIAKLAEALGFQFKIEIVEEYGRLDPATNRWSGIIGKLISNEAHIGICDLTITHERRAAVDFTVPFMSLGIGILFYKETPEPPDLFSFLQPFALEVWVYMKTAYLIISLLVFIMARIAKNEWENPHPCDRKPEELENQWTFKNTSWLTMGSIMGQGCDILPKSGTLRLVCGMWWFFALMMLNSYTANLAAFLTSSRSESSFQSLEDLAASPKIKFGTIRSGSTRVFFKSSNDSLYRSIYSKMETATPSVYTSNNNEGLERVRKGKGKYAFLMETTSMQYLKERNCDVRDVGSPIGEKHYGIAVPLGASYRSQLSVQILKLSERGELSKLKDKWWLNEEKCPSVEKQDSAELSIEQVGGVFLVLGCGLFVAFILGIGEFLWNIQRVAVEDKVTPWEAFKSEILFAVKFWIAKKPVHCAASETSQAGSRRSSANTNKENSEKCISERNSENLKLERSSINLTLEGNSEKLVAERDSDK